MGLAEWCELGKMGEMMKIGDGKWMKKKTGESTVRSRKAGVTKGQGWEQGEEEERRDKQRNRGRGYGDLCVIVSTYCHILSNTFPFVPSVPMIGAERANGKVNEHIGEIIKCMGSKSNINFNSIFDNASAKTGNQA